VQRKGVHIILHFPFQRGVEARYGGVEVVGVGVGGGGGGFTPKTNS
jgi:hypothetical protein